MQKATNPQLEIIVIEVGDPLVKLSFEGGWLVEDLVPEDSPSGIKYSVASTAKNQLVVYTQDERTGSNTYHVFADFDSLKSADEEVVPQDVIAAVAGCLGIHYAIEMDI